MTVYLWDRILQHQSKPQLLEEPALGRYRVVSDQAKILHNSNPIDGACFLVPNENGDWRLFDVDSETLMEGLFGKRQVPLPGDVKSLIDWAHPLREDPVTLSSLSDSSPLEVKHDEKIEITNFDTTVQKNLGFLQEVFRKPRAHLKVEVEKVPVGRARRTPWNALSYLASHTEDWTSRKLFSIVPKKILSLVPEDQLDIYENRLAVRLVDRLLKYLRGRIHEVSRLAKMFKLAADFSSNMVHSTHWRRDRVCKIWGSSTDANQSKSRAEKSLEILRFLEKELSGLLDTPLYIAIPRKARISGGRKTTNILSNDPCYRRVAILWDASEKAGLEAKVDPVAFQSEMQSYCQSFDLHCLLIIFQALAQMGFTPDFSEPVLIDKEYRFSRHQTQVALIRHNDGTMSFRHQEKKVRIVPMVGGNSDFAFRLMRGKPFSEAQPQEPTLVLFLDQGGIADASRIVFKPSNCAGDGYIMVEQVAPWEIESLERVGAVLRWFIYGLELRILPIKIRLEPHHATIIEGRLTDLRVSASTPGVVLDVDGRQITLVEEWAAEPILRTISKKLKDTAEEVEILEGQILAIPRENHNDRRIKKNKISSLKDQLNSWQKLNKALEEGVSVLKRVTTCPVCSMGSAPREMITAQINGYLYCRCPGCDANWGNLVCPSCHGSVPFLKPTSSLYPPPEASATLLIKMMGADIFSHPRKIDDNKWWFNCPSCGSDVAC